MMDDDGVIGQSLLWIQAGLGMRMGLQEKGEWPVCVTARVLMAAATAVTHTVNQAVAFGMTPGCRGTQRLDRTVVKGN